eukprot:scaffold133449_cov59-Phaeocystis_antarctica.AAC.1
MSEMNETLQPAMGPYVAIAEVALVSNSLTAFKRAVLSKMKDGRDGGGSGGGGEGGGGRGVGGARGGGGGAAPQLTATCATAAKRRREDVDRRCLPQVALVAAQAHHRLPRSIGHAEHPPRSVNHAELAHGEPVHVVVEGHGVNAHVNIGARGAVVGESEQVALRPRRGRLGVEVGPRSTHAG